MAFTKEREPHLKTVTINGIKQEVLYRVVRAGNNFHPQILRRCGECGKEEWIFRCNAFKENVTGLCRHCSSVLSVEKMNLIRTTAKGTQCGRYKKGYYISHNGYRYVSLHSEHPLRSMAGSKRSVGQHRLIMAEHLGRILSRHEIVHHKNGDKEDNRLENLEILNRAKHMDIHREEIRSKP